MINWEVRFRNPIFWLQIFLAICTPIGAYFSVTGADFTTWAKLWEIAVNAISNPFLLFTIAVSVWGVVNDPTTKGVTDSERALTYHKPSDKKYPL